MKKFFVVILAFVYLTTSTGFTFHIHYCMGKMANWGLGHNHSKNCSKCGMAETDKGCCKDETRIVKNVNDQKDTESVSYLIPLVTATFPPSFVEITINTFLSVAEAKPVSNASPPGNVVAIYIRNCTFRI